MPSTKLKMAEKTKSTKVAPGPLSGKKSETNENRKLAITRRSVTSQKSKLNDNKQRKPPKYQEERYTVPVNGLKNTDVLLGRGPLTSRHRGNIIFRLLCHLARPIYISSERKNKSTISDLLVQQMKALDPPGRYVEIGSEYEAEVDSNFTGPYYLVPHLKVLEKTGQALRERKMGCPLEFKELVEQMIKSKNAETNTRLLSKATGINLAEAKRIYNEMSSVSCNCQFQYLIDVPSVNSPTLLSTQSKVCASLKSHRKKESETCSMKLSKKETRGSLFADAKLKENLYCDDEDENNKHEAAQRGPMRKRSVKKAEFHSSNSPRDSKKSKMTDQSRTFSSKSLRHLSTAGATEPHKTTISSVDEAFHSLPPTLTAFFSGMFSMGGDLSAHNNSPALNVTTPVTSKAPTPPRLTSLISGKIGSVHQEWLNIIAQRQECETGPATLESTTALLQPALASFLSGMMGEEAGDSNHMAALEESLDSLPPAFINYLSSIYRPGESIKIEPTGCSTNLNSSMLASSRAILESKDESTVEKASSAPKKLCGFHEVTKKCMATCESNESTKHLSFVSPITSAQNSHALVTSTKSTRSLLDDDDDDDEDDENNEKLIAARRLSFIRCGSY